jgi:polysaccharide export outer membrane protein
MVSVSVDLSVPDTTISPEGTIALPLVGALQVENLFIADVEQQIRSRLNQYVKNPAVESLSH